MKVRVFFHDRCFDGAASAALFSRFYRERVRPDSDFLFTGLVHRAGALFDEHLFDGEENAIVDFKYSASPQVTWWFDHHQSAFLTPDDQEHFRKSRDPHRFFFDPDYKSCTKFIADVAQRQFGFDATPVAELVRWADIIDGAQYPDANSAVEMKDAAPRLTMIIEASQDDSLMPRLIPLLAERPLAEILEQPFVAPLLAPLLARHEKSIELLRQRTECREGTVFFDVTDQDLEGHNKFVPYYLHPNCAYSV
ncbi:MAG: phosphoesterase, partial [Terriglobales bacterium]